MSGTGTVSTSPTVRSTGSSSSNTPQHRFEGGRRFHNDENVAYVLPVDAEEDDRMHLQHWAIKLAFGVNFSAPVHQALNDGTNVLDSGCGPATWTLEMANMFPNSNFYGTDVSPRFPDLIKPGNCEFLLHNILDDLLLEEGYFGYIHQRLLILGIKKVDWPKVMQNLSRSLKPGGWIELTEFSYSKMKIPGPNCALANDLSFKMLTKAGLDPDLGTNLPHLLYDAGFTNIQTQAIDVPVNHGGKVGELFWEDFKDGLESQKPIFGKMHPKLLKPGVFEKFITGAGEEMRDKEWTVPWTRVIAQKPLASGV